MYHEMCWYCNILTVPFWFTTSHPRQLPCVFTSTTPQFHPILVARIPIWPPLPVPCCSIRSTDHATFFLSPPCCPPNQPLPALRNTEKQSALTVIVLQVTHKTHTHTKQMQRRNFGAHSDPNRVRVTVGSALKVAPRDTTNMHQPTCINNTTKLLRTLFHHERFANRGIMLAVGAVFFFRHGIQRTQRQLQRRLSTMDTLRHRKSTTSIEACVLVVVWSWC